MSTDLSKLNLKHQLEEDVGNIERYLQRDVPDYPGWSYLLSKVVKNYGICPYLDVSDPDNAARRIQWLQEQPDGGELYDKTVKEFTDADTVERMEKELETIKKNMATYVKTMLENMELPEGVTHESLIENIRQKKETKSLNKKVKDNWNQTLRVLQYVMLKKGVDLNKYIQIVYGYVLRYKAPEPSDDVGLDANFTTMYTTFTDINAKVHNLKNNRDSELEAAKSKLAEMIKNNYKLNQTGRYFKKWSSLSDEKKEERIKSYCYWYAGQNNKSIDFAQKMTTWVSQNHLKSKELRVMDIKWDSKSGTITDIIVEVNDAEEFKTVKRAPRVLKNRRISKRNKNDWYRTDDERLVIQRLNRLLLFEMVKSTTNNKELVVSNVLSHVRTRNMPRATIQDYLMQKYEEMANIIKSNPI